MLLTFEPTLTPGAFPPGTGRLLDPGRLGQGVMTGVGFIGAGVIFKEGVSVQGLTTAACIWAVEAIGMLFGLGLYYPGVLSTVAVFLTLTGLRWVESAFPGHVYALAVFRFRQASAPTEDGLILLLGEHDVRLTDISYKLDDDGEIFEYRGHLKTIHRDAFNKLADRLRDVSGLVGWELNRISK